MRFIPKILAALVVVILIMVNFNVEYSLDPQELQIGVELNTAEAKGDIADYKLTTQPCWVTGEDFEVCRYNPPYYCIISEQGSCSSSDPEQN